MQVWLVHMYVRTYAGLVGTHVHTYICRCGWYTCTYVHMQVWLVHMYIRTYAGVVGTHVRTYVHFTQSLTRVLYTLCQPVLIVRKYVCTCVRTYVQYEPFVPLLRSTG